MKMKVTERDVLLRPEKVEVNGVLYTVKKYPVFNVAENRHNVCSEWRDYFLLQNDEGEELEVHHTCDVLNEDKKVLRKFAAFCEFTRTALNDEFSAVYHV